MRRRWKRDVNPAARLFKFIGGMLLVITFFAYPEPEWVASLMFGFIMIGFGFLIDHENL